jgi:16S rRNA A1518/A1519 N6-dimethyltransferase RsmA/KsgA/DIM1 with predicted DNA glycosylase/AP lyase activity
VAGRRAPSARPFPPRSQHFLRNARLAAELVAAAGIGRHDLVVDVGAGTGRLTAELACVARRVVAVELDPVLAAGLRGRWPNVDVTQGDATRVALPDEPFRVVANPPFARTTELLHRLLDDPRTPLERADLIVEWAVAHKHAVPWPSSLNGVLWGAWYETSLTRRLSRHAFLPPPSVDAGVLVFQRRVEPLVPPALASTYHRFVATGFRRGVRSVASRRELDRICADGLAARDLDAYQWAGLFLRRSRPPLSRARARRGRANQWSRGGSNP